MVAYKRLAILAQSKEGGTLHTRLVPRLIAMLAHAHFCELAEERLRTPERK